MRADDETEIMHRKPHCERLAIQLAQIDHLRLYELFAAILHAILFLSLHAGNDDAQHWTTNGPSTHVEFKQPADRI